MITPKKLTAKLRSVPEAKSIFDKMAELPLWDAAYLLLRSEFLLNMIEFDARLRNVPFVDDPAVPAKPLIGPRRTILRFNPHEMMVLRLKAAHPNATNARLLEAIEAARELQSQKAWKLMMDADFSRARSATTLQEEWPGFEQKTYELAYHDFRVANR
ncbi:MULTISPECIES: hypothetical protein [unclassified Mesorhizobium]|uniref:hypothetical protein n=1 Tax=unclassified Mesorhizobium TaxID=325217 RepID=UPI000FCB1C80|nr:MULTISPECIES: hypothetical protein [unclassified Mesorhizobium]RUX97665.1 hypothetical protein EN993_02700 [Mesorhizobium sp. M7D.F.Ca.US.004.01.2.1]RVA27354.1 hypothetical protein EN935_20580 [Mesorhizobium sp. M7D.F.Ca.US.004.03.1.1]